MRLGVLEDCFVTGSDFFYKWLRKFSIFTVFPCSRFSTWGPKIHLETDILKRQIEIKAWNWCQKTQLGVLEDCSVTGCDFFYKWLRKLSIFTVFHYSRFSTWGPKTHLENDILKRQIEIKAWNWCQERRLGVLEDCSVTGSDFLHKRLRKFSIFTVLHYRRFSVWGPKTQLENDILKRQIEI